MSGAAAASWGTSAHRWLFACCRQKLLNKLAGEQLALAAHRAGGLNPAAMASEEQLWQAAVAAAVAQEAELCGRCSTQQVYQTLASRITALDWEKDSQEEQQQQQQQQPLPSQAAAAAAAAAPPAKRPRLGSPMNQGSSGAQAARTAAAAAPPAASAAGQVESRGAPATKQGHTQAPEPVHARGQLLEVDLDWEAAEEEEEEEQEVAGCSADLAIHINQPGRKGEEQQRGWGREGLDRQQQRRQHPPPSRGQAAGAAPPSREASAASSAKRAPAVRPAPSAVTDISAAPVAELRLISGSPPPGSPGAAPEGTAVGADAPGLLLGAAGVEPEVRLFVQAELEPLRRREQLTAAEYETVCARATAKVIQRHGGAADGAFLAAEGPAISKLVAKYVQKQRQQ